jgi:hypothetical protein
MTRNSHMRIAEPLLEILAAHGEMTGQEFLKHVERKRGDYLDFYPVAALLHGGYITTDSETTTGTKIAGAKLGVNMQDTAVVLCQLILPPGESFQINKCPRDSWHNFPVKMFMTADGYLRLDELEQRRIERKRKRNDYIVSLAVAVLVALLSSYLAHYFATKRCRSSGLNQQCRSQQRRRPRRLRRRKMQCHNRQK